MENINKLNPNELAEITEIVLSTISSLVKMADKQNIDRDSLMKYFATMFTNLVEISTFENFSTDEQTRLSKLKKQYPKMKIENFHEELCCECLGYDCPDCDGISCESCWNKPVDE